MTQASTYSITKLTLPVTYLGGLAAFLWWAFQFTVDVREEVSAATSGVAGLEKSLALFRYEMKIDMASQHIRELEDRPRTEKEEREYQMLKEQVMDYTREREKLQ